MTILIGNTVEEATTVTGANGKELAVQFEATWAGSTTEATLEELHIIPQATWGGASAVFLGIAAENAGAPGTVLGSVESSIKPTAKVAYVLGGFSVRLVKGTKYWLIALNSAAGQGPPLLGKNAGTSTVRTSTKEFTKIETTSEWAAAVPKGPLSFWGTEAEANVPLFFNPPTFHTPSGLYKPFPAPAMESGGPATASPAPTGLTFGDAGSLSAQATVVAKTGLTFIDSAVEQAVASVTGTKANLVFTDAASGISKATVVTTANLVFTDAGKAAKVETIAVKPALIFSTATAVRPIVTLAPKVALTFGDTGIVQGRIVITPSAALVFTDAATPAAPEALTTSASASLGFTASATPTGFTPSRQEVIQRREGGGGRVGKLSVPPVEKPPIINEKAAGTTALTLDVRAAVRAFVIANPAHNHLRLEVGEFSAEYRRDSEEEELALLL